MKVVIVGCGQRGFGYAKYLHRAQTRFRMLSAWNLAGVCDPVVENTQRVQAWWKEHTQQDLEAWRNPVDIAGVAAEPQALWLVCTPDETHFELARLALKRRLRHVVLEKPVVTQPEQWAALCRWNTRARPTVFHVPYVLRFVPVFQAARLRVGELGHLRTAELELGLTPEHTASFLRRVWHEPLDCLTRFVSTKLCHDLDLLMWVTGRSRVRVLGASYVPWAVRHLAPFERGCLLCPASRCAFRGSGRYFVKPRYECVLGQDFFETVRVDLTLEGAENAPNTPPLRVTLRVQGHAARSNRELVILGTRGRLRCVMDECLLERQDEEGRMLDTSRHEPRDRTGHQFGDVMFLQAVTESVQGDRNQGIGLEHLSEQLRAARDIQRLLRRSQKE